MKKTEYLIIAILFYVGWFGSVLLASVDLSKFSVLFPALLGSYLIFKRPLGKNEILMALGILTAGVLFDTALLKLGLITTLKNENIFLPTWLISIWVMFAFSMVKLGQIFNVPNWIAALLGFVMGPMSYKSGEYFQILEFSTPITFIVYAIFWGLAFPLILNLSKRSA